MNNSPNDPMDELPPTFIAFASSVKIAEGALAIVAAAARRMLDSDPNTHLLVFNADTAGVVDLDLRGAESDVMVRYAAPAPRRGRPKLGVIAREVTLLPRHWEWLARQPGGASITLRRLVEAARKDASSASRAQAEAAYRFIVAMAGNLPGFEEATRALFAGDLVQFDERMLGWPSDIRAQALSFAGGRRSGDQFNGSAS